MSTRRSIGHACFVLTLPLIFGACVQPSRVGPVRHHAVSEATADVRDDPSLDATQPSDGRDSASAPRPRPCADCIATALSADEARQLEGRIEALKQRGDRCAAYGEVLERSYRSGRITIRPYMWRVGSQLVSGEAHRDGAIFLAREIDALNVGRRSFDELVWTLEHEAAHLAFNLDAPFDRAPGDRADAVVRECRASVAAP